MIPGWLDAWLQAGLDYDIFWTRTPVELDRIFTAHEARERREHEKHRLVAHEAARLVYYAFHDPKKMPDYQPRKAAKAVRAETSTAADDARVRAYFIAAALRSRQQ